MNSPTSILSRFLAEEAPATPEEVALTTELRTACAARDKAQARVDHLLRQIRDLQSVRRRQLTKET